MRSALRAGATALITTAVLGLSVASATRAGADRRPTPPSSYRNPVSAGTVDTFADPSVIHAPDGYWYAYATTDAVRQSAGDATKHLLPIMRSADLVHWDYVGDVFTPATRPAWQLPGRTTLFAPDIRYLNGAYYLYYAVAQPPRGPTKLFTVGVATAPTPTGPWTDSGGEVVQRGSCDTDANIDPAEFTDTDGQHYLYWGSFTHLCVARLSPDATRTVGAPTQIYTGMGEGSYVVRHGAFYYLFVSQSTCCNGAHSGYQVVTGRATNPLGPFLDAARQPLTATSTKGSIVLAANGNQWVGPGHNGFVTDLSGQTYLAYHGIDRGNPTLAAPLTAPRRPLMLDRLDWINGWPVVNAGAGPSDSSQTAPVTTWTITPAGGRHPVTGDVHAEATLRLTGGGASGRAALTVGDRSHRSVSVWLDAGRHAVVTDTGSGPPVSTALPASVDLSTWHTITVEICGRQVLVQVSEPGGLADPLVTQTLSSRLDRSPRSVRVTTAGTTAEVAEVGANALHHDAAQLAPTPRVGRVDPRYSDDFDGAAAPGSAGSTEPWTWVRAPSGSQAGGEFTWPTAAGSLSKATNTASVLTRPAPTEGSYVVQTEVSIDGGTPGSGQQAGLILYGSDDLYLSLVHDYPAAADPDRSEFVSEGPEPNGVLGNGSNQVGPTAVTMWLRMAVRRNATGEYVATAATSRDGRTWVWGAAWTLPADSEPRIGLVTSGDPGATARFEYFRVYR